MAVDAKDTYRWRGRSEGHHVSGSSVQLQKLPGASSSGVNIVRSSLAGRIPGYCF
jgi:hypothetical protein